jgi:hypothetical protein
MATPHQISTLSGGGELSNPSTTSLELCDWNITGTPQWLLGSTRVLKNSPFIVRGTSPLLVYLFFFLYTTTNFSTRMDNRTTRQGDMLSLHITAIIRHGKKGRADSLMSFVIFFNGGLYIIFEFFFFFRMILIPYIMI